MNGGKCSPCFCVGALNILLSHTAWHITLISSCTDASAPKQTHTQPERKTTQLKYIQTFTDFTVYVCWTHADIPFLTPKRKGMLLFFKARLSSSGLQNKQNYIKLLLCVYLFLSCKQKMHMKLPLYNLL